MTYKIVLVIFFSLCCCKQKIDNSQILKLTNEKNQKTVEYISFLEYNASIPANFEVDTFKSIDADKDSIFSKRYTYKKGKLTKNERVKSVLNEHANRVFLNVISKENSLNNETLGQLGDIYDGGGIKVNLITNKNDTITFKMSHNKNTIPTNLQYIKEYYDSIKILLLEK